MTQSTTGMLEMCSSEQAETAESFELIVGLVNEAPVKIAVLIFDRLENKLFMRFRNNLKEIIPEQELEVVSSTESYIQEMISELGAQGVVDYLTSTFSGYLRTTDPQQIKRPENWKAALDRLFDQPCRMR